VRNFKVLAALERCEIGVTAHR